MHDILSRIKAVISTTVLVLVFSLFCFIALAWFNDNETALYGDPGKVVMKNMRDYHTNHHKYNFGVLDFDLEVNLTGAFNWNVNQLYLYLTAEYETPDNVLNQEVLWDKVISRDSTSMLYFKDEYIKYKLLHYGRGLIKNNNVSLYFSFSIAPYIGVIRTVRLPNIS